MKRKLLVVFLTLSICNLCASSDVPEHSETTPLLSRVTSSNTQVTTPIILPEIDWSRVQLQRISQTVTTLQYPLLPHQTSTGFILRGQGLDPLKPDHLTLRHLESLNKTNWEKWIKAYGVPTSPEYSMAIDSAAEYAKEHANEWENFRREIVDNPRPIYKFCHSGTMKNRAAFFQTANLQRQLRMQDETISTLMARINSQPARVEELSSSESALESRVAALEQKLNEETEKRITLEQRLNEETEKRITLEQRLIEETRQRQTLEDDIKELREEKTVEQTSIIESPELVPTKAEMPEVSEAFTSQIEELRSQFEELKASISTGDPELASQIRSLSEKVDAMDLDGIRADVETLKTTKVGIKYINRFSYLVQALIIAKKLESTQNRYISIEEWKQIVQEQKTKLEMSQK